MQSPAGPAPKKRRWVSLRLKSQLGLSDKALGRNSRTLIERARGRLDTNHPSNVACCSCMELTARATSARIRRGGERTSNTGSRLRGDCFRGSWVGPEAARVPAPPGRAP
eukprot:5722728-Alexandrium_andersonii.AAC.1